MIPHRLLLSFLGSIVFFSCNSDDEKSVRSEDQMQTLKITPTFDGEAFAYGSDYVWGGTVLSFSRSAFYFSQVSFGNDLEQAFPIDPVEVFLFDGDQAQLFQSQSLPKASSKMRLSIGLDASLNHADPTKAVFPLDQVSMHWGWNPDAGYKFVRLEGQYDSDDNGIIEPTDKYFEYHCATDDLFTPLELALPAVVNGDTQIDIRVDFAKLLDGVDVILEDDGHGSTPATNAVVDNFASAMQVTL